jgi:hypothetical protein
MVLDGNVDPVAWTNGGEEHAFLSTSLRLRSDEASAKTLNAFLALCGRASKDRCAFSAGSAALTRVKWETLLHRLRQQPVTIKGQTIDYAALVSSMSAWLTTTEPVGDEFSGWTSAAALLQKLWRMSGSGAGMAPADPAAPAILTAAERRAPDRRASGGVVHRYAGPE